MPMKTPQGRRKRVVSEDWCLWGRPRRSMQVTPQNAVFCLPLNGFPWKRMVGIYF